MKKILIAEDEKPMAKALKLKLDNSGFEAQIASNGQEAIDMLSKEKFDLVLLDLVMPKVDGFTVLETLKTKKINVPVIITSNLSQEEDAAKAKSLGAKDYLIKSNTPIAEIVDHVKKILKV
jgi:DNA-binding response OmpR family regulator